MRYKPEGFEELEDCPRNDRRLKVTRDKIDGLVTQSIIWTLDDFLDHIVETEVRHCLGYGGILLECGCMVMQSRI